MVTPGGGQALVSFDPSSKAVQLDLRGFRANSGLRLETIRGRLGKPSLAPVVDLSAWTGGDAERWPEVYHLPGHLSTESGSHVIDHLPVLEENAYQSPMFLMGLAFFEDWDAAISTFFGDIWRV